MIEFRLMAIYHECRLFDRDEIQVVETLVCILHFDNITFNNISYLKIFRIVLFRGEMAKFGFKSLTITSPKGLAMRIHPL